MRQNKQKIEHLHCQQNFAEIQYLQIYRFMEFFTVFLTYSLDSTTQIYDKFNGSTFKCLK